jgi:hypothetical protein
VLLVEADSREAIALRGEEPRRREVLRVLLRQSHARTLVGARARERALLRQRFRGAEQVAVVAVAAGRARRPQALGEDVLTAAAGLHRYRYAGCPDSGGHCMHRVFLAKGELRRRLAPPAERKLRVDVVAVVILVCSRWRGRRGLSPWRRWC